MNSQMHQAKEPTTSKEVIAGPMQRVRPATDTDNFLLQVEDTQAQKKSEQRLRLRPRLKDVEEGEGERHMHPCLNMKSPYLVKIVAKPYPIGYVASLFQSSMVEKATYENMLYASLIQ